MQTIDNLLEMIEKKVINGDSISPAQYVEIALRINFLKGDLDNKIVSLECILNNIEARLLQEDMSSSKAKVIAKSQMDYQKLLELKAKSTRIEEFIMLAKRRAVIQDI